LRLVDLVEPLGAPRQIVGVLLVAGDLCSDGAAQQLGADQLGQPAGHVVARSGSDRLG
jgi:hypothetical protein